MHKVTMKAARVSAGYTQKEAAKKLGVGVSTLAKWEKGKHSPLVSNAIEMCKLYGIPFEMVDFSREEKTLKA